MALFKISRGGESKLPNTITDGWAYFTPDTKNFFIDVNESINGQNFNERIQINEKPISISKVLYAQNWNSKSQTITVDNNKITGMWYVIDIVINSTDYATLSDIAKANIQYDLLGNTVKFSCAGNVPTHDISLTLIFTPKERHIEQINFMRGGNVFNAGPYLYYDGCTWQEWIAIASVLNPEIQSINYSTSNNTITISASNAKQFTFDMTSSNIKPMPGFYNVVNASGYGASEPT